MSKRAKYLITCLLFSGLVAHSQKVKLKGDISGLEETSLVIHYYAEGDRKSDSVKVKNGKFKWVAKMAEPQKIGILFPRRFVQIFVESSSIKMTGTVDSLDKLKISGSKSQDEMEAYNTSLKDITEQEPSLYQKWGKVSKEEQIALEAKLDELRIQKRERARQYIVSHPESYLSISMVSDRAMMGEYDDVNAIYEKLARSAQQTAEGKRIAERLAVLKRSAIGEQILDFTQSDTEGKPVHFANFKGKYVFVDFWASWCGPCRAENPNVLKAYNQYKDKNFTVVGVSLDDNGEKWKKAIRDDKMPWTQLSDLKGWKNEVATYYGIQGIPSSLLIDPQGKIVAKDLRGEKLNQKLEEIIK